MTVLIHGRAGDECLRLAVRDNEIRVEDFTGTPQFELDCLTAVRTFFSNYPTDRAAFPPAVQQWLPLPMFFSSRDTM